jgi:hypothetical protein
MRTLVLISSLSIRHGSSLLKTIDYLVWLVAWFETINLLSDEDAKKQDPNCLLRTTNYVEIEDMHLFRKQSQCPIVKPYSIFVINSLSFKKSKINLSLQIKFK